MRHDATPEEMAVGLYRMGWEFSGFCIGTRDFCRTKQLEKGRDPEHKNEVSFVRSLDGTAQLSHKGCWTNLVRLSQLISRNGWRTPYPLEIRGKRAPGALCKWVGMNDNRGCTGQCIDKKEPILLDLSGQPVSQYGYTLVYNFWAGLQFSEMYAKQQLEVLIDNNYFNGDPNGLELHQHYIDYAAQLRQCIECLAGSVEVYDKLILGGDSEKASLFLEMGKLTTDRCTDSAQNRDWCSVCKADLSTLSHNPIPKPSR